jgi:hypothetical protein
MHFKNIEVDFNLNDQLSLNEIEMELITRKANSELPTLLSVYFPGAKGRLRSIDNANATSYTTTIPLTEAGKKTIKALITNLKELDARFEKRESMVDEFKNLLED